MPRRRKKRPVDGKHPIELTTDEAIERVFSKEVRDELKRVVKKPDTNGEKPPHK
jgi:hypothetical protein